MKNKGSSLYEVLKSASRPGGEAAPAAGASDPPPKSSEGGQPTLQDRLAAFKAAKLAMAAQAGLGSAETGASAATAEATPPPAPPPEPTPPPVTVQPSGVVTAPVSSSTPEPGQGPGERVLRLTYNTAVFAGLIAVGLLFIAYAVGVKSGRAKASETPIESPRAAAAAPAPTPAPVPPPPAPRKEYAIRLAEWRYGTARERGPADFECQGLIDALTRAGFKGLEKVKIERAGEPRLALYIDRWSETASSAAKARLATLQKFTYKNAKPLAQAGFEEVPRSQP